MRVFASSFQLPVSKSLFTTLALLAALPFASATAQAQSLGYEGPTGVFVTPLALVADSPAKGVGIPSASYHFLAGGPAVSYTHLDVYKRQHFPRAPHSPKKCRASPLGLQLIFVP